MRDNWLEGEFMEIIISILFWILLNSRTYPIAYQMVGTETDLTLIVWMSSLLCKRSSVFRAIRPSYILPVLALRKHIFSFISINSYIMRAILCSFSSTPTNVPLPNSVPPNPTFPVTLVMPSFVLEKYWVHVLSYMCYLFLVIQVCIDQSIDCVFLTQL